MKNTSFIAAIIWLFSVQLQAAVKEDYRSFMSNRFDLFLDTSIFNTTANFDANGGKQDLIANANLQSINTQLSARYVILHDLGLYSGVKFNNIETNNGIQSRTNSLMTYYFLGADYELYRKSHFNVYFDFSYAVANEEIDIAGDTAIASDGASEAIASGVVVYENSDFRTFARVGVNYRGEGLSLLTVYGFGADYAFSPIRIGVSGSGLSTIQDDEKTNTPVDRDLVTTRVNGGSRKYFSVNPNLLEAQLYLTYSLDKDLSIKAYAATGVVGSNSAQGMTFGGALNWGFGASQKTVHPDDVPNTTSISDQDPAFKVDTNDGVNQDLFQKTSPLKTVPKNKK